jgi:hypothetical protein
MVCQIALAISKVIREGQLFRTDCQCNPQLAQWHLFEPMALYLSCVVPYVVPSHMFSKSKCCVARLALSSTDCYRNLQLCPVAFV